MSVGHDEYWSGNHRANVEAARAARVHLAFFSGNEMFWKTRWESSIDGSGTRYRTLVCYKETNADVIPGTRIDPNPAWTGTWRDPTFSPPSDGGRPANALTGTNLHGRSRFSRHDRTPSGWRDAPLAQYDCQDEQRYGHDDSTEHCMYLHSWRSHM
ncbi:MAG: N,N-dimethylformamidase beta subunit family domain-containing protein [Methylocella sp.]